MSSIIYTLIGNESSPTPLAEISLAGGNFHLMAIKLLDKCKGEVNISRSYAYEQEYMFHYHNKDGLSVLCMANASYSNRLAYEFLFKIRDKIFEEYGKEFNQAIGFSLKKHFIEEVKQIMQNYNIKKEDKIAVVQKNIDEVKNIMIQNIDKILERGDKIEILVTKTDELQSNAVVFNKTAKKVKMHFLCKNLRLTILVSLILLAVIMLIVILSCGGFNFDKCS